MLLLPPTSCTKPVMVPLLMMLVLLLAKSGLLATARSDKCANAAVIGQGRGAAGRAQDNAGGR